MISEICEIRGVFCFDSLIREEVRFHHQGGIVRELGIGPRTLWLSPRLPELRIRLQRRKEACSIPTD
jgi:hypothetical protein